MTAPAITMDQVLGAFGQPATVQILGSPAIETSVMWLPQQVDRQPDGVFARVSSRRILVLRRDEVPDLPRGARVVVGDPPDGSMTRTWIVDGPISPADYDQIQGFDHYRVLMVPDESDG